MFCIKYFDLHCMHFSKIQLKLRKVEVEKVIKSFSNETCILDDKATKLLKQCAPVKTLWITVIVNESLKTSTFPSCLRQAVVKP